MSALTRLDNRRAFQHRAAWLLALTLTAACQSTATEVFRCKDARGKWIFTDNRHLCPNSGNGGDGPQTQLIRVHNLHSQYGSHVSEEFYNYAFRAYETIAGRSITLIAEKKLIESDPELLDKAIAKLEQAVATTLSRMPRYIHSQFSQVRYYLFIGDESRTGGRKGGMWYFRKDNGLSARFDDSIVVRSASDFMTHYSDQAAARTALHELSHAYYHYHRRIIYQDVKAAYDNAVASRLYRNVALEKGGVREKAYALTNDREYFAELSKIYHMDNAYYPFNREELRGYDPVGYRMIEKAFRYGAVVEQ